MSVNLKAKLVDSVEAAYKEINSIPVDLDKAVELLMNFNADTTEEAKQFKKLARKFNGSDPKYQEKQTLKFMKEKLFPKFKTHFLDVMYPKGEYEILKKEIIAVYIFGSFIEGHATTTQIDIPTQFKLLTIELTNRIYGKLFEEGKKELERKQ